MAILKVETQKNQTVRLENVENTKVSKKAAPAKPKRKSAGKFSGPSLDSDGDEPEIRLHLHDDDTVSSNHSSELEKFEEAEVLLGRENVGKQKPTTKDASKQQNKSKRTVPKKTAPKKRAPKKTAAKKTAAKKKPPEHKPEHKVGKGKPSIETVESIERVISHRLVKKKPQFKIEWDNGLVIWGVPKHIIDDGGGKLVKEYIEGLSLHIRQPWKGVHQQCKR